MEPYYTKPAASVRDIRWLHLLSNLGNVAVARTSQHSVVEVRLRGPVWEILYPCHFRLCYFLALQFVMTDPIMVGEACNRTTRHHIFEGTHHNNHAPDK